MDVHYSSETIVIATTAYEIKVYNGITKALSSTITTSHKATINSIAISPNGSVVATGSKDFTVEVYDISSGSSVCAWG